LAQRHKNESGPLLFTGWFLKPPWETNLIKSNWFLTQNLTAVYLRL